jgi:hypothetical protein
MSFFADIGAATNSLTTKLGQGASGVLDFANNTLAPLAGQLQQWQTIANNFKNGGVRPPPASTGNVIVPGEIPVAAQLPAKPPAAEEVGTPGFSAPVVIAIAAVALLLLAKGK